MYDVIVLVGISRYTSTLVNSTTIPYDPQWNWHCQEQSYILVVHVFTQSYSYTSRIVWPRNLSATSATFRIVCICLCSAYYTEEKGEKSRGEIVGVYLPLYVLSQLYSVHHNYTTTLLVMVDRVLVEGGHPPRAHPHKQGGLNLLSWWNVRQKRWHCQWTSSSVVLTYLHGSCGLVWGGRWSGGSFRRE
jgi:hypothetical protein